MIVNLHHRKREATNEAIKKICVRWPVAWQIVRLLRCCSKPVRPKLLLRFTFLGDDGLFRPLAVKYLISTLQEGHFNQSTTLIWTTPAYCNYPARAKSAATAQHSLVDRGTHFFHFSPHVLVKRRLERVGCR